MLSSCFSSQLVIATLLLYQRPCLLVLNRGQHDVPSPSPNSSQVRHIYLLLTPIASHSLTLTSNQSLPHASADTFCCLSGYLSCPVLSIHLSTNQTPSSRPFRPPLQRCKRQETHSWATFCLTLSDHIRIVYLILDRYPTLLAETPAFLPVGTTVTTAVCATLLCIFRQIPNEGDKKRATSNRRVHARARLTYPAGHGHVIVAQTSDNNRRLDV